MNIVITGASRGIGWELVQFFAQNTNNQVFAISRNSAKLAELTYVCKNKYKNKNVVPLVTNLADTSHIASNIRAHLSNVNHIDILVNNAGSLVAKPFDTISINEVENMYRVNFIGPFELTRVLLPQLKKAKMPHVVNISSMGGFQGSVKFPGLSAYASSKAAIANLTECLAEEYKETHLKFNCLALGAVATEMLAEAFPGYEAQTSAKEMAEYIYNFALNGHKMFNGKILPVSKTTP